MNKTVLFVGSLRPQTFERWNDIDVRLIEFEGNHEGIFTNMKTKITKEIEEKIESLR